MEPLKLQIQAYFDRNADVYDTRHGVAFAGQRYNFAHYYEPFLSRAISAGDRVLELGCGTGVYSRWLIDRGCDVVGMDISPRILDQARRRSPEGTFVIGDCEDPAAHLPEGSIGDGFDAILGVSTFSYYPNKAAALRRYRDLLRPGGRVVLIEVNGRCPYWRMMTWFNKNEIRAWFKTFRAFDADTLDAMLTRAGMPAHKLTHFAFIPNGVGALLVHLLRPLDAVLHALPRLRRRAMRVGVIAQADDAGLTAPS